MNFTFATENQHICRNGTRLFMLEIPPSPPEEQDWQDRQFVQMTATHTDFGLAQRWLEQMGAAALTTNITIQYCMTLPRQLLQVLYMYRTA